LSPQHAAVEPESLFGFSLPLREELPRFGEAKKRLLARLRDPVGIDWTTIGPHLTFDPRAYVRLRLYRNRDWEVLVLCWLPGHQTVVHDHGGSWGAVAVLAGTLEETLYCREGDSVPLTVRSQRKLKASRVTIESLPTIHRVRNASAEPAVSLHVYSPPLSRMTSFDVETGRTHVVEIDTGPPIAIGGNPHLVPLGSSFGAQ